MKVRSGVLLSLLCFWGAAAADELTAPRYVLEVNVDASNSTYYFKASSSPESSTAVPWGPASCPNAEWVYARDLPGMKDILAVAMSASAMGRTVKFRGTCDADNIYFRVTRIIMTPT